MKSQEQIAISLAFKYHDGQTRRGGAPYINHLMFVAEHVNPEDDDARAIAWLHDILEDTECTCGDLLEAGIKLDNIQAVGFLTRTTHQSYMEYIQNIPVNLRVIKIADMVSNLTDDPTPHQIQKYIKALKHLSGC